MTAVSTRTTSARPGAPMPVADGPVPVPRVVGNRRIRAGGIALAVMLLALGAALSGLALASASRTSPYLAVNRPVAVGALVTGDDVTTVRLSGASGLNLIPASGVAGVVGRRAAVSLVPGTALTPADLTDRTLVGTGQAQVGIGIAATNLPAATLTAGAQILLVPLSSTASASASASATASGSGSGSGSGSISGGKHASGTGAIPATLVDISSSGSTAVLHVAVDADLAPAVVTLNASGGLGVVLKAGS